MRSFAALALVAVVAFSHTTRAELGSVYFKVTTTSGSADTWTGAFEVADLSQTILDTLEVSLTTAFVGGLTSEPGLWFTSGNDIFVWQGDNESLGANSTIYSLDLVTAVDGGVTWQGLFGQTFNLLGGLTTDLSVLNPVFLRVSGQGGTIQFSNEPFPVFDPYTQWLANYPSLAETNKFADPDGDGFNNGTEFAYDGNPTVGTPAFLRIARTASNAVVSFVAHNSLFPDSYVVLSSTNLVTASFATNVSATGSIVDSPDQSGLLLSNIYTRKQFTVPLSAKEFFRVKAFLP